MLKISDILKNLNILYIEDNLHIKEITLRILEPIFNKVYYTNNLEETLSIFEEGNISIVLLDYATENINSIEIIKKIKEINKKIPIIILSDCFDKEKLISCIRLGIIDYIEKPLTSKLLMDSFNRALIYLEENNLVKILLKDNIYYDYSIKSIINHNKIIRLTKQEIEFLEILLKNHSKLILKEDIMNRIFGNINVDLNTLRNILYRLRKKIGSDIIITIKDLGFMIRL